MLRGYTESIACRQIIVFIFTEQMLRYLAILLAAVRNVFSSFIMSTPKTNAYITQVILVS